MSTLADWKVIDIAKSVAAANNVGVENVVLASAIASTGAPALEITLVVKPESSRTTMGERSTLTISQLVRNLADAGEERIPIIWYEEQVASPRS
jgi:hypothetical protein